MNEIHEELMEFLHKIRKLFGNSLQKVIVYGSYARGDYHKDSDVDIMVLTNLSDDEIKKVENDVYDIAFDILMDYGTNFSVIVKNDEHFIYWLEELPFYKNISNEGVVISG